MKTIVKIVIFKDVLKYSYRIDRSLACVKRREGENSLSLSFSSKKEWTSLDQNWTYLREKQNEFFSSPLHSIQLSIDKKMEVCRERKHSRDHDVCVRARAGEEDVGKYQSTCPLIRVWFFSFSEDVTSCITVIIFFSSLILRLENLTSDYSRDDDDDESVLLVSIDSHVQWY